MEYVGATIGRPLRAADRRPYNKLQHFTVGDGFHIQFVTVHLILE